MSGEAAADLRRIGRSAPPCCKVMMASWLKVISSSSSASALSRKGISCEVRFSKARCSCSISLQSAFVVRLIFTLPGTLPRLVAPASVRVTRKSISAARDAACCSFSQ
jgi:hypothetical protein